MENLQVTNLEQLKKVKRTEIVELGKFEDGTPFVAELKRPNMMELIAHKKIPNTLLTEATQLFNGKNKLANKASIKNILKNHKKALSAVAIGSGISALGIHHAVKKRKNQD